MFVSSINTDGALASDFWLMRLPHCESFGHLLVKVQSYGLFEGGRLDDVEGIYKAIDGHNIKIHIHDHDTGSCLVPYTYVVHVPPTKVGMRVHCLQEGGSFGARFRVRDYDILECNLTAFRGGHKGKILRSGVSTIKLASVC